MEMEEKSGEKERKKHENTRENDCNCTERENDVNAFVCTRVKQCVCVSAKIASVVSKWTNWNRCPNTAKQNPTSCHDNALLLSKKKRTITSHTTCVWLWWYGSVSHNRTVLYITQVLSMTAGLTHTRPVHIIFDSVRTVFLA